MSLPREPESCELVPEPGRSTRGDDRHDAMTAAPQLLGELDHEPLRAAGGVPLDQLRDDQTR